MFLNIFGMSASNVLEHVLKISLLILDNINKTCSDVPHVEHLCIH